MKYLIEFIEEIINEPNKEYDSAQAMIIEEVIEILENQLENDYPVNLHMLYGGLIIDLKVNLLVYDKPASVSLFVDKKFLSVDVLYNGEYLEVLNLNKPEFKNEGNDSYWVLDNLVQELIARLW